MSEALNINQIKKIQAGERKKINKDFAERLDSKRIELGLNKAQVSRYCNVSAVTCSYWFNGRVKPNLDNVNKLAKVLGTTSDYLLHGEIKCTKGIDPKIMKTAIRIVKKSEIYSGKTYSTDKFSSQVLSVCHRLSNKSEIKVTKNSTLVTKILKLFVDDFDESEDNFESALNKACLTVANP